MRSKIVLNVTLSAAARSCIEALDPCARLVALQCLMASLSELVGGDCEAFELSVEPGLFGPSKIPARGSVAFADTLPGASASVLA